MAKNLTLLNMHDMLALITDATLQRKFIRLYAPVADDDIDWNGLESGRGFYPAHETIATTLPQMVMYGVDVGDSHDIPSGSVYSLRKNANASNRTFSSKVGANFIEVDITEVYSR